MKITVKNTAGKKQEYTVEETDTIASIKNKVHEKEGLMPDQQRLIFNGRQLPDGETGMLYI